MIFSKQSTRNFLKRLPKITYVFLGLALFSQIILISASLSPTFALYFDNYVSRGVRAGLAFISSPFPFSIAELLIILSPIFVTLLIIYALKRHSSSVGSILSFFITLASCATLVFTLFVFSFGVGYHTPSLYQRLEISNNGTTASELKEAASMLVAEINNRAPYLEFTEGGASKMPCSTATMNDLLSASLKSINKNHGFVQGFKSRIKPVLLSAPMSRTHTTGVYSFFTGEVNLNMAFPDYTLPYTAAHELAHQHGIAREDEANFAAFLICAQTTDTYIEYCAYLNLFEYVAAALYTESPEAYKEIYNELSPLVKKELAVYSDFYGKYQDSKAGKIGSALNNAYLTANGSEDGAKSYDLVVDLAVAYLLDNFDDK